MDLADLGRLCWVLVYRRSIVAMAAIFSISSGWVCLFGTFVD